MKFVIDRFEGEYAVLENIETQEMSNVMKSELPDDVSEGCILFFDGQRYSLDIEFTQNRRQVILSKFEKLKNNTSD